MTMKKMFLVIGFCFWLTPAMSHAQDDVKFSAASRSTVGRLCLVASVDHQALRHRPQLAVYEDSGGKFVELSGGRVSMEQYSTMVSQAVSRLRTTLDQNRDSLLKTIRWPFVAWRDPRSSLIVTELDSGARKIWETYDSTDMTLEQMLGQMESQYLEKEGCGALLVIWAYNKAGIDDMPIAYAGLLVSVFRAKTREVLYRRSEFSSRIALAEAGVASKYTSAIARVMPKFYEDIAGYELPDLRRASERGEIMQIRTLLDAGVDVNTEDNRGRTALYKAAETGRLEVVKMLIAAGGTPVGNAPDLEVRLRKAAEDGDAEKVQPLVQAGVNINATDLNGRTALYKAAEKGRLDVLKMLLDAGAVRSARGNDGKTALDAARKGKHREVIRVLESIR